MRVRAAKGRWFSAMNDATPIWILIGVILLFLVIGAAVSSAKATKAKEERRQRLLAKYGDNEVGKRIADGIIWTGETAEQLRDSLGNPADIDQKVLKTKKEEIWKYAHKGGNRYGMRITVENDCVVGWDEKL